MASIKPYKIAVPKKRLHGLWAKLDTAEFPDELEAADWDYGVPLAEMKRLTAQWSNRFDWRRQEEQMNKLPNFQTEVQVEGFDTLNIHFIYQKSENPHAIPLLFVHGCESELCLLMCGIIDMIHRAWQFPGSGQAPCLPH